MSLVARTPHYASSFFFACPRLPPFMDCNVCPRFSWIYGAKLVSVNPKCSAYVLIFQQYMHRTPQIQYVTSF